MLYHYILFIPKTTFLYFLINALFDFIVLSFWQSLSIVSF